MSSFSGEHYTVDVSDSDLDGISLMKRGGAVVPGRLELDGIDAEKAGIVKFVLKPKSAWDRGATPRR